MIRVNLVEPRRPVETRLSAFDLAQRVTHVGGAILVITALAIGWRYWDLSRAQATLEADIAAAQREEAQLASILQQVQSFETRRQQLQQRVALIDELRKGQAAPVHMIDQVSRALPEGMWLTRLQQAGYDVTIEGECLSLTALSDFVGNLEASLYFKRPVEIIDSEVVPARENRPDVIRFSVKGTFQMAGIEPKPAAVPAAAGGPRG
jgi:type IV pilus assembly protein PilN